MIAHLTGSIHSVSEGHAVIDVNGVGYLVYCARRTLQAWRAGQVVSVPVQTVVREDRIDLFGFAAPAERDWFGVLTAVQGVGARVALSVLDALDTDALAQAISGNDAASLTRASGVGAKLAGRIVRELQDKAPAVSPTGAATSIERDPGGIEAQAVSALVHLGYKHREASTAVARALRASDGAHSVDRLVPAALRELAP